MKQLSFKMNRVVKSMSIILALFSVGNVDAYTGKLFSSVATSQPEFKYDDLDVKPLIVEANSEDGSCKFTLSFIKAYDHADDYADLRGRIESADCNGVIYKNGFAMASASAAPSSAKHGLLVLDKPIEVVIRYWDEK